MYDDLEELTSFEVTETPFRKLNALWDIFILNGEEIVADFEVLTKGRSSQPVPASNTIIGNGLIFLEPGAKVEGATLNASEGPIYIGKNALVMEGSLIRGPFALGENSVVKMGAKIYGPTTVGPHSTVGGEIKNVVIFGNTSKGHEGYLGNSVIGEWCNLGADTNCSNLKNNWSKVSLWSYVSGKFEQTGELKAGLFMGDHSMCGINTMFNTGTVTGICCNIFGADFQPKFIPSFSWGGNGNFTTYRTDKALEAIDRMMSIHKQTLDTMDRVILLKVFEDTLKYRTWDTSEELPKIFSIPES
jgi:UDP-N-acetylglucosamine diphosphorylase/glucosamine-1-phosphate N-acetyltransferase